MKYALAFGGMLLSSLLYAESADEMLEGFDDVPAVTQAESKPSEADALMDGFDDENTSVVEENSPQFIKGLSGELTQQLAYSYNGTKPHNDLTSVKSSFFLDYEHKFENGWRVKTNAKAYYDAIYDLSDRQYSQDELSKRRSDVMLFDAYVQGSIIDKLDMKLGRQVVVWGRSDTIRITDILNPLDNRRPGLVDIEDLRLPVTMAKFDFFYGDWRVTPLAVLEQRFSLNPAYGSDFNPQPDPHLNKKEYRDVTYALSLGGEFEGWDVNFYAARVRNDAGHLQLATQPTFVHDKVTMLGTAMNILSGSWLFKTELAHFSGLKYTSTQNERFSRTDALVGLEYNGIADTLISYDISLRHFNNYDAGLLNEMNPLERNTYQQAFRVSSDFMNATLKANYLISLFGKKLDEGGYQRAWLDYEWADGWNTNLGVIDYIGGSPLFDVVRNNDMIFADISYSF